MNIKQALKDAGVYKPSWHRERIRLETVISTKLNIPEAAGRLIFKNAREIKSVGWVDAVNIATQRLYPRLPVVFTEEDFEVPRPKGRYWRGATCSLRSR